MRLFIKCLCVFFLISDHVLRSQESDYVSYGAALEVLKAGDYEKAIDYFSRYLRVSNMHDEAYFQRGNAYYGLRKYDEALNDYLKAYSMGYNSSRMLYNVASIYREKGLEDGAIEFLNKALNINPGFIDSYLLLGDIYSARGDLVKAKESYKKAFSLDPSARLQIFSLGQISMEMGDYKDAIKYFSIALGFDSLDFQYNYSLGVAYYHINDTVNSLNYLRRAAKIDENNGMPIFYEGKICYKSGNYVRALELFSSALQTGRLTVSLDEIYRDRAMCYANISDFRSAIEDINNVISINPSDAMAYVLRGIIRYQMGNDTLALADFNKVITISPDYAQAYLYRGLIYLGRSLPQLAREDFTKALELSPDDTLVLFHMGNFMLEEERYMDAINYYNKAFSLNPKFYRIFENRGIAYYNLGYYRLASVDFDAAIKHNPSLYSKLKPFYIDARRRSGM